MGNFIASLDFMLRVALIPRESINRGGDGGVNFDEFVASSMFLVAGSL